MIKPVHDNILVKVDMVEIKKKTESGIIINSRKESVEKRNTGIVIEVGEGRLLNSGTIVPSSVKPGDHIIFNAFAGSEIIDNNETFLLLKENDIVAILS